MDRELVIKAMEMIQNGCDVKCRDCCFHIKEPAKPGRCGIDEEQIHQDALSLLKEQEDRHRLEVHNIGNVDIPEGVSEEHFHLVMNNVVEALQHTDKGESYPYEDTGR